MLCVLMSAMLANDWLRPPTSEPKEKQADGLQSALDFVWSLARSGNPLWYAVSLVATAGWTLNAIVLAGGVRSITSPLRLSDAVAAVVFLCAYALRAHSKAVLGQSFTYEVSRPPELINTGPYSLFVHPGYEGGILTSVAFVAFAMGTRSTLVRVAGTVAGLAIAVAAMQERISNEEAFLVREFGPAWPQHIKRKLRIFARTSPSEPLYDF